MQTGELRIDTPKYWSQECSMTMTMIMKYLIFFHLKCILDLSGGCKLTCWFNSCGFRLKGVAEHVALNQREKYHRCVKIVLITLCISELLYFVCLVGLLSFLWGVFFRIVSLVNFIIIFVFYTFDVWWMGWFVD